MIKKVLINVFTKTPTDDPTPIYVLTTSAMRRELEVRFGIPRKSFDAMKDRVKGIYTSLRNEEQQCIDALTQSVATLSLPVTTTPSSCELPLSCTPCTTTFLTEETLSFIASIPAVTSTTSLLTTAVSTQLPMVPVPEMSPIIPTLNVCGRASPPPGDYSDSIQDVTSSDSDVCAKVRFAI
jgi:hypothetical protein